MPFGRDASACLCGHPLSLLTAVRARGRMASLSGIGDLVDCPLPLRYAERQMGTKGRTMSWALHMQEHIQMCISSLGVRPWRVNV